MLRGRNLSGLAVCLALPVVPMLITNPEFLLVMDDAGSDHGLSINMERYVRQGPDVDALERIHWFKMTFFIYES